MIITGHSAGGQLTQRYALGSSVEAKFPKIHFRYIVVNPGSYAYLNSKRPANASPASIFATPRLPRCAYNAYKYGLESPNTYLAATPTSLLLPRYLSRDVIYFLGEKDTDTSELDDSCEAHIQGINRLMRGLNFKAFLDHEFPGHLHQLFVNPGIAHTQWGMYTSEIGKKLLFSSSF